MATEVIKKDGVREPFDPQKVKNGITAACAEAGLDEERTNQVVEEVYMAVMAMADSLPVVEAKSIKEKILSELDRVEPLASAAWRKHEAGKSQG